jgi:hypothetical protein
MAAFLPEDVLEDVTGVGATVTFRDLSDTMFVLRYSVD